MEWWYSMPSRHFLSSVDCMIECHDPASILLWYLINSNWMDTSSFFPSTHFHFMRGIKRYYTISRIFPCICVLVCTQEEEAAVPGGAPGAEVVPLHSGSTSAVHPWLSSMINYAQPVHFQSFDVAKRKTVIPIPQHIDSRFVGCQKFPSKRVMHRL